MTSQPRGSGQGSFTKLTASVLVCMLPYASTTTRSKKKHTSFYLYSSSHSFSKHCA